MVRRTGRVLFLATILLVLGLLVSPNLLEANDDLANGSASAPSLMALTDLEEQGYCEAVSNDAAGIGGFEFREGFRETHRCGALSIQKKGASDRTLLIAGKLFDRDNDANASNWGNALVVEKLIEASASLNAFQHQEIIIDNVRFVEVLTLDRLHPRARLNFRSVVFEDLDYEDELGRYEEAPVLVIDGSHLAKPLVFENTLFRGMVRFQDSVFQDQVRFDRITFDGPVVISNAFFRNDLLLQSKRDHISRIYISDDSESSDANWFHDQLLIDNVDVSGDVDLGGAIFTGVFFDGPSALDPFSRHVDQPPMIELNELMVEDAIKIENVLIEAICENTGYNSDCRLPLFNITDSQSANVFRLAGSDIPRLRMSNNRFGQTYVEDNRLFDAVFDSNHLQGLVFELNRISEDLRIDGNNAAGNVVIANNYHSRNLADWSPLPDNPTFSVTSNVIGGALTISPIAIGDSLKSIDLRKNRTDSDFNLLVPVSRQADGRFMSDWVYGGVIDLSASSVGGTMFVQAAQLPEQTNAMQALSPSPTKWLLDNPTALSKAKLGCPALASESWTGQVVVSLSAVKARTFSWELPFEDCNFRWEGSGIQFDFWGDMSSLFQVNGNERPEPKDRLRLLELLLVWRGAAAAPSPEIDRYLGGHLLERGDYSNSRELQLLSRKGNYTQLENRDFVNLQFEVGQLPWYVAMWRPFIEVGRNIGDMGNYFVCLARKTLGDTVQDCEPVRYPFIRMLMSPSGYGAKPEWSLGLIAGLWAMGGLIYWYFARSTARALNMPLRPTGLGEAPAKFAQSSLIAGMSPKKLTKRVQSYFILPTQPDTKPPGDFGTQVPGFLSYDSGFSARSFSVWTFSLDAVLPVIDLHCYTRYYPAKRWIRWISRLQHVLGWWLATNLLASAAIGFS